MKEPRLKLARRLFTTMPRVNEKIVRDKFCSAILCYVSFKKVIFGEDSN